MDNLLHPSNSYFLRQKGCCWWLPLILVLNYNCDSIAKCSHGKVEVLHFRWGGRERDGSRMGSPGIKTGTPAPTWLPYRLAALACPECLSPQPSLLRTPPKPCLPEASQAFFHLHRPYLQSHPWKATALPRQSLQTFAASLLQSCPSLASHQHLYPTPKSCSMALAPFPTSQLPNPLPLVPCAHFLYRNPPPRLQALPIPEASPVSHLASNAADD